MKSPKINPDLIPEVTKDEACRILDAAIRRLLRGDQERKDFEAWKQAKRKAEAK